jgi:hypothetical protein
MLLIRIPTGKLLCPLLVMESFNPGLSQNGEYAWFPVAAEVTAIEGLVHNLDVFQASTRPLLATRRVDAYNPDHMGYKIVGCLDRQWRCNCNPTIPSTTMLSINAIQLLLPWTLRHHVAFQSGVLVVPPEVSEDLQKLRRKNVNLSYMDKESEEGCDGFKQFNEAVRQSTAALFVTNNMDMFDKAILVYKCQSAFTQSWTFTIAVNAGMRNDPGIVSGFLHVDPNLPGRVTKIACDLDPTPEDGFLWFLNVGWHWIHDPAVLANDDEMPVIPVPLVSSPFREGVAVPSFPRLQSKAPCTFLLRDNLEDSGLGMLLNLSQIVCH